QHPLTPRPTLSSYTTLFRSERVTLLQQDVRSPSPGKFDVINALNFSYWIFRTRDEMRRYFTSVRKSLKADGAFFLDAYGGWESQDRKSTRLNSSHVKISYAV